MLFFGWINTAGTNITRPPVVTVATNLNSDLSLYLSPTGAEHAGWSALGVLMQRWFEWTLPMARGPSFTILHMDWWNSLCTNATRIEYSNIYSFTIFFTIQTKIEYKTPTYIEYTTLQESCFKFMIPFDSWLAKLKEFRSAWWQYLNFESNRQEWWKWNLAGCPKKDD